MTAATEVEPGLHACRFHVFIDGELIEDIPKYILDLKAQVWDLEEALREYRRFELR